MAKKRQNLTLKRLTEEDTKMIIIFECIEKNLLLITRILYYWFPNLTSKIFFARKIGGFYSNLPFSWVLYIISSFGGNLESCNLQ